MHIWRLASLLVGCMESQFAFFGPPFLLSFTLIQAKATRIVCLPQRVAAKQWRARYERVIYCFAHTPHALIAHHTLLSTRTCTIQNIIAQLQYISQLFARTTGCTQFSESCMEWGSIIGHCRWKRHYQDWRLWSWCCGKRCVLSSFVVLLIHFYCLISSYLLILYYLLFSSLLLSSLLTRLTFSLPPLSLLCSLFRRLSGKHRWHFTWCSRDYQCKQCRQRCVVDTTSPNSQTGLTSTHTALPQSHHLPSHHTTYTRFHITTLYCRLALCMLFFDYYWVNLVYKKEWMRKFNRF